MCFFQPIQICILGPPLSGKTKLAERLSEYYGVPHIHVKEIIEGRIKELERLPKTKMKEENEEVFESGSENEEGDPENLLENLKGRLDDAILCK